MDGEGMQLSNKVYRDGYWIWTVLNFSDKIEKTKNWLGCFEINSIFRTSVLGFLPDLSRSYNMVRVVGFVCHEKWMRDKRTPKEVCGEAKLVIA